MFIKLCLYLTIACTAITANNWTISDEGQCFYTVIATNTSEIATAKISTCDNIDPYVTFIIANTSSRSISRNFVNTNFNPWIRIFTATNNTWPTIFSFAFSNLQNLLYIDLSGNRIEKIHTAFKDLKALDSLNLSYNRIEVINPETFTIAENETKLHLLDLSFNLLSYLDRNLFERLHNLRMLYLQGNKISIVGEDSFADLTKIVYLNLCCNKLTKFNIALNNLVSLADLDVSYNNMSSLSNFTFNGLVSLRTIDLSNNQIEALPSHFLEESTSLVSVNLKYNKITNISNYVNNNDSTKIIIKNDINEPVTVF